MGYLCAVLPLCIAIGVCTYIWSDHSVAFRDTIQGGLWVPKVYSMSLHTHLCSAMYTGTYGQCVYVEGVGPHNVVV